MSTTTREVKPIERTTFATSRDMEFFTEKELTMQIGHARDRWPIALVKELIDNALDAAERAGVGPRIEVTVEEDAVTVRDNGPGLPVSTLERSLDYSVRVSDKAHYVSPTRGQLGNALKCVWAAPFVASGGVRGVVEIAAQGTLHRIEVSLDQIAQKPQLKPTEHPSEVKTGTSVTMHWPSIASYLGGVKTSSFYHARRLLQAYATFNPHASFVLRDSQGVLDLPVVLPKWSKWVASWPTCPHWYTPERLQSLIAAYLAEERAGGKARTVREFVAEFAGLQGSAKRRAVTEAAGLSGCWLRDLVRGGEVDQKAVERLLEAMTAASRAVKPTVLGIIGEEALAGSLVEYHGVDPESIRTKSAKGTTQHGLPYVLEVALGVRAKGAAAGPRIILVGLNWTPALEMPFPELPALLGEMRLDSHDPVVVLLHLACPRLEMTDRGKSKMTLPAEIRAAVDRCIRSVTKNWKRAKRQTDRQDRLSEEHLEQQRKGKRAKEKDIIKRTSWEVMEAAYLHTSGNGIYPAQARQVMYSNRNRMLPLSGGKCWSHSSHFTQRLLPDFMEAHPDLTAGWDVIFDARGRLVEPHTKHRADLGTKQVRDYANGWLSGRQGLPKTIDLDHAYPTSGPEARYRFVLFVEKEGFAPLLERAHIAERYDVAIMSTKGMSVTAARQLVEWGYRTRA